MAKGRPWSVASRLAMVLVLAARLGACGRLGPDGMPQVGDGIGDSPLSAKGGGDDGRVSQSADIGEESCKCIGAEDKRSFGWECQAWPAGPASFATTSPPDTQKTAWCYVGARCPSKIAVSEESGDLRALPDSFPHWPHAYFRLGCPTARDTAAHKAMDELALMHELALQARHTHGDGDGGGGGGGGGQDSKAANTSPPPTPYPAVIDKALLMKDFYDAYFRPHLGFRFARGEQGACLADKALHLLDMLECTAPNLAQQGASSGGSVAGNGACSGAFVDGVRRAARECCSGLEHLPTWDAKKSCEKDVAPALGRLQGMARGLRKCVGWLQQNSRSQKALGDAASPAVCAHALFALPSTVNAIFFAVHRRMAFDTTEEGDPIFGMAHVYRTRKFVLACAPKIMEPRTHNELMSAAFSHACRHMVNQLWQGLAATKRTRERQARKDEEASRQVNEAAARKRIAAQDAASAAYKKAHTPAPTPRTACPAGFRNIWSAAVRYAPGDEDAKNHLECVREMKPHKEVLRRTTSAPTPAPASTGPTPKPTPKPTPEATMKPHFEVPQQDDDDGGGTTTAAPPRRTVAPHMQKPHPHTQKAAGRKGPATASLRGQYNAAAAAAAAAVAPASAAKKSKIVFASAADAAAAAQHAAATAAASQTAYGDGDDDDFQ